jgi:hypothetical protein
MDLVKNLLVKNRETLVLSTSHIRRSDMQGSTPPSGGLPLSGSLPLNTPVTQMMPSSEASKLSPDAAKLTKANLLELAGVIQTGGTLATFNITVDDLQTIEDGIRLQVRAGGTASTAGLKITGCTCSPCCCCSAAAVIRPIRPLA